MSIIKGNAGESSIPFVRLCTDFRVSGEIAALAGSSEVQARGVDSVGAGFANPARIVRDLARRESESSPPSLYPPFTHDRGI
jgi:hypothetical protein